MISVIVENSMYTGHNKTRTIVAKKSESATVIAIKSSKENYESSPSVPSAVTTSTQNKTAKVQQRACDSTVKDSDFKSEKRKLFSCDFDGCNKKYTKLSHLKVDEYLNIIMIMIKLKTIMNYLIKIPRI